VAGIGVGVVMLSVAMLVVVMSVMNGFRAELIDKIDRPERHAVIQGYRKPDRELAAGARGGRKNPRSSASPLIEAPLLVTFKGRVRAGGRTARNTPGGHPAARPQRHRPGYRRRLPAGRGQQSLSASVSRQPRCRSATCHQEHQSARRATPFGTVPRQVA
jgi:lipoprotein-releasing system permease protein